MATYQLRRPVTKINQLQYITTRQERLGDPMVSALDSGSTLALPLSTQVYKWELENLIQTLMGH